ncbi:hypothetical protein AAKU67_002225 [Oxalobacteraceae bacterium GrIS 2.11]
MAAAINSITPHLLTLKAPAPLRALQGWLCWRLETHAGEVKARKIPYYFNGSRRFGVQGAERDRSQLTTFDMAKKAAAQRGFDGVGLALMPEFGITALDFDDCVTSAGLSQEVEAMLAGTYAEYSPSGKGVRAFVLGDLGNKKSFANAEQYGFETFHDKGFVTFTGVMLDITELTGSENSVSPPSESVLALCTKRFNSAGTSDYTAEQEPILGLTEEQINQCLHVLSPDLPHDEWLHIGMGLHHETNGDGFDLWNDWSALGIGYPGREVLESRWLSFGQSEVRPVTARSLVRKANEHGAGLLIDIAAPSEFSVIPEPTGGYFNIRSAADFVHHVKPITWLIKGVLPKATMGVLYGESGSGKSFVAFDISAALGRGIDWNNRRGRQARVLYVVAEGVAGFNSRIRAYCHQTGCSPKDLCIDVISDVVPNLSEPGSITNLLSDIRTAGPYDLIVMDTFAQVTPGANENSGEDMGKALSYCKKISHVSGAMVLLVHHSGKDASKGARGWSGIKAAMDVELEVTRYENDRCLTVTKLKDGQGEGDQYGFNLHTVVLGQDDDGDDITSCIVGYCEAKALKKPQKPKRLGELEMMVLSATHELCGADVASKVPYMSLRDAAINQLIVEPGSRDQRASRISRAVESLIKKGLLLKGNDDDGDYLQIPAD